MFSSYLPSWLRARRVYSRPSNARMMMMTSRSPTIPPGPYPQLLLYPQVGRTPINASINRTINIVPRLITSSFLSSDFTRLFVKRAISSGLYAPAEEPFLPWGFAPETLRKFTTRRQGEIMEKAAAEKIAPRKLWIDAGIQPSVGRSPIAVKFLNANRRCSR